MDAPEVPGRPLFGLFERVMTRLEGGLKGRAAMYVENEATGMGGARALGKLLLVLPRALGKLLLVLLSSERCCWGAVEEDETASILASAALICGRGLALELVAPARSPICGAIGTVNDLNLLPPLSIQSQGLEIVSFSTGRLFGDRTYSFTHSALHWTYEPYF